MSHVRTHTDTQESTHFLKIKDLLESEKIESFYYSEPNYSVIDEYINKLKVQFDLLGEIAVLSDESREVVKQLAVQVFKAIERYEQWLLYFRGLPEYVPWKQKAYDKLEEFVILLEDIGEICALSANEEFTQMIEAEIESLADESSGD